MRIVQGLMCVGALLLAGRAMAQEVQAVPADPQPQGKRLPAQGSVAGHVTFGDTRGPARGARIMLLSMAAMGYDSAPTDAEDAQPHMGVTGLEGNFVLWHVRPGDYVALAFAAGYLSPIDGIRPPKLETPAGKKAMADLIRQKASLVHVTGQESARVDIELQRGAVLSGRVLYSDGTPAGQLHIRLERTEEAQGGDDPEQGSDAGIMMRAIFMMQALVTDDQGRFRIAGVSPGSWRIAVTQTFDASANVMEEMLGAFNPQQKADGKLTIYSGNTLHRKAAKSYVLRAGDSVDGIEITLPLTGLHSVRGVAAGKDGVPLNSGALSLNDTADPSISFQSTIEAAGEFHFSGVPEGTYELKVTDGMLFGNAMNVPPTYAKGYTANLGPLRAFAETKVAVIVQTTDIDNLAVTLADTKLPEQAPFSNAEDGEQYQVVVKPH